MLRRKDYHLLWLFITIFQFINYSTLAQDVKEATSSTNISSSVTSTQTVSSSIPSPSAGNTSDANLTSVSSTTSNDNETNSQTTGNTTTLIGNNTETTTDMSTTTPMPLPPSDILSIFFVNDLRYDIFPVRSDNGSICDTDDNVTECIGGVGRLRSYIKNEMNKNPNTLWLNAGNTLGGEWFKILKYKTAIEAIKFLNFSLMAVGPDVFQYGQEASDEFLEELNSTVSVSNIDSPTVMKAGEYFAGTCNILVIGFVDDIKSENNTHGVTVNNITEAIIQAINDTDSGQNSSSHLITIALGSTSRQKSIEMASTIDGIDIILYSGNCTTSGTGNNTSEHFCLDYVNNTLGDITYVYSLGMNHSDKAARFLLGELQITLGDNCTIDNISHNYHDYSNETDDPWTLNLTKIGVFADLDKKLTENTKNLSGEIQICSHAECTLGNLIADSMLAGLQQNMWDKLSARLALFPAVMSYENKTINKGNITARNLYTLIQEDAYLYTVSLTGLQLSEILKISLNSNHRTNSTGFLHISNMLHMKYNKTADNKFNIISIDTVLDSSDTMHLKPIDMNDTETLYDVIVPYSLFEMDSYKKVLGALNDSRIIFQNMTVMEAVIKVVNNTGFLSLPIVGIRQQESEPIVIVPQPECPSYTGTTILVTLVVTAILLGACYGIWWYIFRRRRERSGSTLAMMHLDYGSS